MFDRKTFRPWVRRFATLIAVVVWSYSFAYTTLCCIWKSNEEVMKSYAISADHKTAQASPTTNVKEEAKNDWMPLALKKGTLWTMRWGWIGVPIAALLELFRKWLISHVRDKQTEKAIKKVIDYFYEETKPEDGLPINYRVTLFKYRRFSFTQLARLLFFKPRRNPWKGWLAPYERSGSFRNRTNVRWAASLDEVSQNKGVAGKVFCEGSTIRIEGLASKEQLSNNPRKRELYAKSTNCPVEWVNRKVASGGELPRSFWGTIVETSTSGAPWGVLLIDSNLDELVDTETIEREAKIVLKMLVILLTSPKEP